VTSDGLSKMFCGSSGNRVAQSLLIDHDKGLGSLYSQPVPLIKSLGPFGS
jgi:hypothetical protein